MTTLPNPFHEALKILIAGMCLLVATIALSLAALTGGCSHQAHPATVKYVGRPAREADGPPVMSIRSEIDGRPVLMVPAGN